MSSSNYNKFATGFQISLPEPVKPAPPPVAPVQQVSQVSKLSGPIAFGARKVATPKFRAVAPSQSWSPGGGAPPKASFNAADSLSADLSTSQNSQPTRRATPPRWQPAKGAAPVKELPSCNSLVMDNLNATYSIDSPSPPAYSPLSPGSQKVIIILNIGAAFRRVGNFLQNLAA